MVTYSPGSENSATLTGEAAFDALGAFHVDVGVVERALLPDCAQDPRRWGRAVNHENCKDANLGSLEVKYAVDDLTGTSVILVTLTVEASFVASRNYPVTLVFVRPRVPVDRTASQMIGIRRTRTRASSCPRRARGATAPSERPAARTSSRRPSPSSG